MKLIEFYAVGLNRIKEWELIDRPNNYLLSASHCWLPGSKKFRLLNSDMRNRSLVDLFFLDSGGFQLFNRFGKYPFSCVDLVNFATKINVDELASMDYPCEGADHPIKEGASLSNQERIQLSVDNALEMKTVLENVSSDITFYPVIQGYSLNEYLSCADKLKEQGLGETHLAIGSVCLRKRIKEIEPILTTIRKEFTRAKIHVFGLTVRSLRYPSIVHSINSIDSLAWSSKSTKGYMFLWDEFANKLRTVGLARIDLKKETYKIQQKDGSIQEKELTVLDRIKRYHIDSRSAFLISLRSYKRNIEYWSKKHNGYGSLDKFIKS